MTTTTTTPTIDRMDVREALAAYDLACTARETAKEAEIEAACGGLEESQIAMRRRHDDELAGLRERHRIERDAVYAASEAASSDVTARYDALPEIEIPDIGDAEPLDWYDMPRCALTGLVLLEGDQLLEDPDTGDQYLRAALGLKPRVTVEIDDKPADDGVGTSESSAA
jgi:hypothetical protein